MNFLRLFVLLNIVTFACSFVNAAIPPCSSLLASTTQKIGLSDVTIVYTRMNANERTIFGDLVPFGEVWSTGKNRATTLELETDVTLAGQDLEKGKYAIFTIPGEDIWTVIINKDSNQFGTVVYNSKVDVLRFTVPTQHHMTHTETFEIHFTDTKENQTNVVLAWADTSINFEISVSEESNYQQMMSSLHWRSNG